MSKCAEYDRLENEVESVLSKLAELTSLQLKLFQTGKLDQLRSVDKELENTVGAKERAIGALRQHTLEHKCRGSFCV